jgi:hypothetical protein
MLKNHFYSFSATALDLLVLNRLLYVVLLIYLKKKNYVCTISNITVFFYLIYHKQWVWGHI